MRLAALGLLLLAVYAATLSIPATAGEPTRATSCTTCSPPASWVEDGDLDLANQYAQDMARVHRREPQPERHVGARPAARAAGRRLPLAISPAYGLGGPRPVELAIAAMTALAFVLAAALARRIVPEPWASMGVLVAGLSPPALAAATTVSPEPVGAALIAGASLCALRVRERARLRHAYAGPCCSRCCRGWTRRSPSRGCRPPMPGALDAQEGRRLLALSPAS